MVWGINRFLAGLGLSIAANFILFSYFFHGDWKEFLAALGVGIAGSFAASLALWWAVQKPSEKAITQQITNEIGKHLKDHFPSRIWPASDSLDEDYVSTILCSMKNTGGCHYRGDRALNLCYRLLHLHDQGELRNNMTLEILLVNPNEPRCLRSAASYRTRSHDSDTAIKELRLGIFSSIYGLYQLRQRCNIRIGFINDIALYRIEILDEEGLFLSFMPSLQGKLHPDVSHYKNDTKYYRYFKTYFSDIFSEIPHYKMIHFNKNTTEDNYQDTLKEYQCDFSPNELQTYFLEYKKYFVKPTPSPSVTP